MSVSNSAFGTSSSGGSGAVSSVSNSDGSLTISPTTGSVVASLNTANANTFSVSQFVGYTGIYPNTPTGTQYGLGVSSSGNFNLNGSPSGNDSTISIGGAVKMIFTTGSVNLNNNGLSFVNHLDGGNQANQSWTLGTLNATSTNTLENSGTFNMYGTYWNGSAPISYGSQIYWIQDSTTPTGHLSFNLNNNGTLTEIMKVDQVGNFLCYGSITTGSANYIDTGTIFSETGSIVLRGSRTTLNGTTAGSILWSMPLGNGTNATYRKVILYFNGYENTTSTAQTITFPTAFIDANVIIANTTGTSPTLSLTTLTLPINMSSTASGVIIIEVVFM